MALDVTSSHRLPLLDALKRAQGSVKREEIVGRGAVRTTTSLQGDRRTILADNRTTATPTTGRGVGLVVACVEVAVPISIFRRIPVQATDDARENTQLLSSIITNNSDLDTNCDTGQRANPRKQKRFRTLPCACSGLISSPVTVMYLIALGSYRRMPKSWTGSR